MNMMNRFVEGRGHQREIDMLLELTCVGSSCHVPNWPISPLHVLAANKSKAAPSAPSATQRRGPFRASCGTSARRWRGASQNSARAKVACSLADVSPATLTPPSPYPTTSAVSSRRLGHRQRKQRHDIAAANPRNSNLMSLTHFRIEQSNSMWYCTCSRSHVCGKTPSLNGNGHLEARGACCTTQLSLNFLG